LKHIILLPPEKLISILHTTNSAMFVYMLKTTDRLSQYLVAVLYGNIENLFLASMTLTWVIIL
jgi:hypothetical protein